MTDPRKLQGYRYLPLCLLLLSAGTLAEIRDVRMHGPNGDAGSECTEADAASAPGDTATPAAKPAASAVKPTAATRIKPVVTVRGGDGGSSGHAARWHSFLPGMFR